MSVEGDFSPGRWRHQGQKKRFWARRRVCFGAWLLVGGIPWAAAYPVSSPCQSIRGSTGRSHRWGCRSHCWHRSRAGHSPAQSALQHTLWAQDSLAPALPPVLLRPPPTAAAPLEVPRPQLWRPWAPDLGGNCPPPQPHHPSPVEFPSCAHSCIPLEAQLMIPFEGTD